MSSVLNWDEMNQSEEPAVVLLQQMGWTFIPSEQLEPERESLREVLLLPRVTTALKRLNPWISEENIKKAIRNITRVAATSLMETNEKNYISLTYGTTVTQDFGDGQGSRGRTVHFIDFDNPHNNEFIVTRQLRISNAKNQYNFPDIVLFVNGLPLAVIECKSPKITEPTNKGVEQMLRYQELLDKFDGLGCPRLFETTQIVATLSGQAGRYATVGTPKKFWAEWKVPYPLTLDEFQKQVENITPQNVLVYGVFSPTSFLDLIHNFIVYEVEEGKTVKKLARYQQFVAVNNAIKRILNAKNPGDRGGIIWHTQGSGKSLTMVYMAIKLRRLKEVENPTLVIVTDRTDLDGQITTTFQNCGFPNPIRASRISHLKELLAAHEGKTILSTIQKFGGITGQVTDASNVFVMVDEAHRTQYKSLAAKMRQAIKNACFLGFTGTPIDKKGRSTFQTFGPYIHTYTIEEAIKDGATLPIFYESRLPELRVLGESLDAIFDRIFREYTDEEKEEIKSRYATEEAIAGAPKRIERICLDLINHFENYIYPNKFKAQIVAVNRETAVLYKQTLDRLGAPPSALIMSINHNDPKDFRELAVPKDKHKEVIDNQFKKKDHPLAILIVCDMLLTGFDAPVEQVMYLDSPLKEHTLLQAIARVNRVSDGKDYGLIVDYWGISEDLQKALDIFNPEDIVGALRPKNDELPRLEARHQSVMRFFQGVDKGNIEAVLSIIDSQEVRVEFDQAFRRFSQSLDIVLPDPAALKFTKDLRWLNDVRKAARNRFRDDSFDLSGCGEKVKKLIEEHIQTDGIIQLLEPVSIFSREFDERLEELKTPEAKASEMEHAIKHEINIKLDENPIFYKTLKQKLEYIIEARRQQRIDAAEQLRLMNELIKQVRNVGNTAQALGMSEDQFAFYKLITESNEDDSQLDESKRELSSMVLEALNGLAVIDWQNKEDVQREMRRQIKRLLRIAGYGESLEDIVSEIMDLARVRLA